MPRYTTSEKEGMKNAIKNNDFDAYKKYLEVGKTDDFYKSQYQKAGGTFADNPLAPYAQTAQANTNTPITWQELQDRDMNLLKTNYVNNVSQLESDRVRQQQQANNWYELAKKYFPESMKAQGLSNLGMSDTAKLQLYGDYTDKMQSINSNYQNNLNQYNSDYQTKENDLLKYYGEKQAEEAETKKAEYAEEVRLKIDELINEGDFDEAQKLLDANKALLGDNLYQYNIDNGRKKKVEADKGLEKEIIKGKSLLKDENGYEYKVENPIDENGWKHFKELLVKKYGTSENAHNANIVKNGTVIDTGGMDYWGSKRRYAVFYDGVWYNAWMQ